MLEKEGPMHLSFKVPSSFMSYKSGVYRRQSGEGILGGHAVELIGYGEDEVGPYWICANSWGESWGDKGYFKIEVNPSYVGYSIGHCDPEVKSSAISEFLQ